MPTRLLPCDVPYLVMETRSGRQVIVRASTCCRAVTHAVDMLGFSGRVAAQELSEDQSYEAECNGLQVVSALLTVTGAARQYLSG